MQIELEIENEVSAAPEQVFDLACGNTNLSRFFLRFGPIPGVTGCTAIDAEPGELARRKLLLTDGTSMVEIIAERNRPIFQRYVWAHAPAAPLHLLVRGAEARWRFEPVLGGARTRVSVRYIFFVTSRFALPAVLVVRALFKLWLTAALTRIKRHAESRSA